jgi:hypothetical protein
VCPTNIWLFLLFVIAASIMSNDIKAMFGFLAEPTSLTDKPGEGPFNRAFFESENAISLCIENETGTYKAVLHLLFDDTGRLVSGFFSKGEPFNLDNWSPIAGTNQLAFELPSSDKDIPGIFGRDNPLNGLKLSCCEVIFAMKAMLTFSGIERTLAQADPHTTAEVSRRLWEEGKYRDADPAAVGDACYLRHVAERELAKMLAVIEGGNAEKMKKAGREFSGVFTFAGKEGQADLRLDGLPWHRVACALLYHLKLRLWLARPGMRWALAHLFRDARVREASANDALYAVILSKGPKAPGSSPVDPLATGCPAAAAAAAAGIDDDWRDLDEGKGNLLGKVCQAAIATLAARALVPDFGAPDAALRRMGFGPVLLTPAEVRRLAEPPGPAGPPGLGGEAGGGGRGWLLGVLRGLGAREIRPQDLAIVQHRDAAAAAAAAAASAAAAGSDAAAAAGV